MTYTYHKVAYEVGRKYGSIVADRKRKKITVCASLNDEKEAAIAILSGNPTKEGKRLELSNGAADVDKRGELYAGTANTRNPRPCTGKSRGVDYNRKVASTPRRVIMEKEMSAEKWEKMTDKQKARFCRKQVSNIRRKK